jgi:hypothetical protein
MKKIGIIFLILTVLFFVCINKTKANNLDCDFQASIKAYSPTVSNAGMGGAWAGITNLYGNNPAALPKLKEYEINGALYGSYNLINFSQGPNISLRTGTILTSFFKSSVLRVDYHSFGSNNVKDKYGINTEIKGEGLQIGIGKSLTEKLSFGITFIPIDSSEIIFQDSNLDFLAKGKGKAKLEGRIGILYNFSDKLSMGVIYEYNKVEIKEKTINFLPENILESKKYSKTQLIRSGISFLPWEGGNFSIDYLYGKIDDYSLGKWFIGVEQWLNPNFAIRTGLNDGRFTAGISIIWKKIVLDCVYLHQGMRDMEKYWGDSPTFAVSLSVDW